MSEEFYKNDNNSRDGYKSQNGNSYGGNRFGSERPSRPRFNRTASPVNTNYNQRGGGSSYRPRYNGGDDSRSFNSYNNDNGYQRPSQGGYRPRYNSNNGEGGYQRSEGGYQQRAEGGYQQRGGNRFGKSRYGQSSDRGGYQQRQGGYRPRYDQGNSFEGEGNSYNKPSFGGARQQGGYRQAGGGYGKPRFQGGNSSFGGARRGNTHCCQCKAAFIMVQIGHCQYDRDDQVKQTLFIFIPGMLGCIIHITGQHFSCDQHQIDHSLHRNRCKENRCCYKHQHKNNACSSWLSC